MIKYPKLLILGCSFIVAYLLFHYGYFDILEDRLNGHGYVSVFLGGLLFSFGFTTPFGIALLIEAADHVNPFLAALIAGMGALLTDVGIFNLVRFEAFHNEFDRLRMTTVMQRIYRMFHNERISDRLRTYMLWSFAGFVIASPLPDELGVSLVSGITDVNGKKFGILCFVLNTLGILTMLLLAR